MKRIPLPRFFITGLCMQGNKGGPALALSLVDVIRQEIPEAEFIFSVPGTAEEWPHEVRFANHYGFEVRKNVSFSYVIPPFSFKAGRRQALREWWKALRHCDSVIQMSAISYFGPPSGPGSWRSMLFSPRFFDFIFSRLAKRQMVAWTQSYGPFSTTPVRIFARQDLSRQRTIFCRGDDCLAAVKQLLPKAKAMSFPDVAVTLPFDKSWGRTYLAAHFFSSAPFVTFSPSAVMYSRDVKSGSENGHVMQCREISTQLIKRGYSVLLVPHTLRPAQHDPKVCDLAVADIIHKLVNNPQVMLVNEDLSPIKLKSIIANADFHVGARYHSVVAALSTGVPAISLSWHPKYRDLMRTYGVEEFVFEGSGDDILWALLEKIDLEKAGLRKDLHVIQKKIVSKVRENARLFCEFLLKGSL